MRKFNENKFWFKGNFHTHTNRSDGLKSYNDCLKMYCEAGYDFIAITDHGIFNTGDRNDDILVLSGIEYDYDNEYSDRTLHIVAVGMDEDISFSLSMPPQNLINEIKKRNGIAVIAHPSWSLMLHEDALGLSGYDGVEIWNSDCEDLTGRGYSGHFVDVLASNKRKFSVFAVDDTHNYKTDVFDGFIMVNAPSLDAESIKENILNGNFYATQGPLIRNIMLEGGVLCVETTPVCSIAFMSNTLFCEDRLVKDINGNITRAEYHVKESDIYVRIECMDLSGKKCWSQPIWLKE